MPPDDTAIPPEWQAKLDAQQREIDSLKSQVAELAARPVPKDFSQQITELEKKAGEALAWQKQLTGDGIIEVHGTQIKFVGTIIGTGTHRCADDGTSMFQFNLRVAG